jgi:hypothetical protein
MIAGVRPRIAEDGRDVAVVRLVARLGQNFDSSASRSRVLGRIWILIDANLLYGRCTDVQRIDLHAIDDEGHAAIAE